MRQAKIVATLTSPPSASGEELDRLPEAVQLLEVLADRVGDLDPDWLRDRFRGRLLYTLRSRREGGGSEGPERRDRLLKAAAGYDLVDLEGERDLVPEVLDAIPERRRLISWHGAASAVRELAERFARFRTTEAAYYRLVTTAEEAHHELVPLLFLASLGRSDVAAYAAGSGGGWSQVAAPLLGSPLVFGSLDGSGGHFRVAQLIDDFALPDLTRPEAVYGIVGGSVSHSLSPRLHNAGYRASGLPALYLPFRVDDFDAFWRTAVTGDALPSLGLPIRGLTVIAPHKESALRWAATSGPRSERVGAANLLVAAGGAWTAGTTDPEGVLLPLSDHGIAVAGRKVAVVGCGGAGRGVAAGLQQQGAEVWLVNRTVDRGRRAAAGLGLPFRALADFSTAAFPIVVHATPVGRDDDRAAFAIDPQQPPEVVVDLVYQARPTRLIADARSCGCLAIDGKRVLAAQARSQLRRMTGGELRAELAAELLQ